MFWEIDTLKHLSYLAIKINNVLFFYINIFVFNSVFKDDRHYRCIIGKIIHIKTEHIRIWWLYTCSICILLFLFCFIFFFFFFFFFIPFPIYSLLHFLFVYLFQLGQSFLYLSSKAHFFNSIHSQEFCLFTNTHY